mgnify:CR=1 FL=1
MSLQDAVCKSYVNDNITKTVSEVKQRHSIKETTAINGPEGTVSNKTQVSLKLLKEGMHHLPNSIASINNNYLEDIELCPLLKLTVVDNLHAVSHFKHETLTASPYSQDFGIITKESLKRVTKLATKYFTHEKSYYRVPHTSTEFANVNFLRPLLLEDINPETESAMTFLTERMKILPQLRFLDPGGPFAPIFARIL